MPRPAPPHDPARRGDTPGRRREILDAALSVLAERGYRDATMLEVARRARASKETLYAWFGDKRGLFGALIAANAEALAEALGDPAARDAPPEARLAALAEALAALLLGDRAVVVNRAAIAEAAAGDTGFAALLAERGRLAFLPRVAEAMEAARAAGRIAFDDPEAAAEAFLGLVLGDRQVRRLLGLLPAPSAAERRRMAERAVALFLRAHAPASAAPAASPGPGP